MQTQHTDGALRVTRLASVDACRGLFMLLLFGEVLRLCTVAAALPESRLWRHLCTQQSHAQWVGLNLHDLIQPGFTFLVGVSVALSLAKRRVRGASERSLLVRAGVRSAILVVLGIAIVSFRPRQILFEDTLTQIGLGYPFVAWLALRDARVWWIAFWIILIGWWALFASFPLPPSGFDYSAVGITPDWLRQFGLTGWEAHWQKNANVAYAFDEWFLRLLPGNAGYVSGPGLTTLNFVPTIATMILGLVAGDRMLKAHSNTGLLRELLVLGVSALFAGALLAWSGLCPLVKSLWTPTWVLVSGGVCALIMAAFFYGVEILGLRRAAFPLVVIGCNSLFAYLLHHAYPAFAFGAIRRLVGNAPFEVFGPLYVPVLYGLSVIALYWLILLAFYQRRWFIRL